MRRKRRAERFGTGQLANGEADEEEKKKVARAEKFGAGEAGLGKLNEALPMEREKGRKRGQGGDDEESHALDDPGLIRRGRGRGGFRGRARVRPGRGGGGGRGGTPDRPTGVSKPAYINDKDKLAAEARKKRFAAQS
jgi:SAP domain-containing ribonucleoprotein